MSSAWVGVTNLAISYGITPLLVAFCRRKSTRLTAVVGGLTMALAILFASFAKELHQVMISFGLLFGLGCGMVRETSVLMVSQYFKRKRQNVEILTSMGGGLGLTMFTNLLNELITAVGWRHGLQVIAASTSGLFFLGMFYRSASLYHPQRRAILHLKDMSKKKGKDKNKIENKPPYFDFATLRLRSLQVILLSTVLCSCGVYSPILYFVPMALAEGLRDQAVLLQTFIGLGMAAGTLCFGLLVVSRSKQCLISRQYLLQTSIFGIGFSILALSSLEGYHGYLLFVWMYGVFLGGFHYVLKVFTFERIRAKHFPRGWSFVQGARALPILFGLPLTGYMNVNMTNNKAGYYLSFVSVILGGLVLFFMDWWKKKGHSHQHRKPYSDIRDSGKFVKEGTSSVGIEHENLSQKLSDAHPSGIAGNSVVLLSDPESIKDAETLNQNNNAVKGVTFSLEVPYNEEDLDDDDGHSYHFRGKPELLAGISEENLLVQLEIEYQGDITSCNKVENYLQYSEYDYEDFSNSSDSSHVHSEQVTAPVKKRCGATMNHSFSEPDLARLVQGAGGARGSPRSARHLGNQRDSPRKRRGGILPWARLKQRAQGRHVGQKLPSGGCEMPVILEDNP